MQRGNLQKEGSPAESDDWYAISTLFGVAMRGAPTPTPLGATRRGEELLWHCLCVFSLVSSACKCALFTMAAHLCLSVSFTSLTVGE